MEGQQNLETSHWPREVQVLSGVTSEISAHPLVSGLTAEILIDYLKNYVNNTKTKYHSITLEGQQNHETSHWPREVQVLSGVTSEISAHPLLSGLTAKISAHQVLSGLTAEISAHPLLSGLTAEISAHPVLSGLTAELNAHPELSGPTTESSAHPVLSGPTAEISAHSVLLDVTISAQNKKTKMYIF